ncbi:MAG: PAS domain-containing protein [Verrucomicrobia bacterium]|nr:PAS domain-containing protein [Verrucomicrobiota bacterium]
MKSRKIFERYIQIADVLGKMFPHVLEIALHDFSDLDHSIVHIVNGHISQRKIGDAASELGIRRLLSEEDIPDVLVNYINQNSRGQKCKSASMAIRDDSGKMIGAFCLNFDLSQFEQFHRFLEFFMAGEMNPLVGAHDITDKHVTNEEEIQQEIKNYLLQNGLSAIQLTYKDKQDIVKYLHQKGFFKKRSAITAISASLQLTRQCIYNYLKRGNKNVS